MKKQILACVIVLSSSMILFALEKEDKIMVLIENIEKTTAAESAATLVPVPAQQIQQKDIKKTREILDRVLEEKMIDEREALTLQRIKEAENKSAATDLILGVMIMINFLFLVYIMVRLNGREK